MVHLRASIDHRSRAMGRRVAQEGALDEATETPMAFGVTAGVRKELLGERRATLLLLMILKVSCSC